MTPTETGSVVSRMVDQGTGGTVNELLIQMQSFDEPTTAEENKHVIDRLLAGSDRRLDAANPIVQARVLVLVSGAQLLEQAEKADARTALTVKGREILILSKPSTLRKTQSERT